MFCQKCGNKLNDNAIFCDKCGNKNEDNINNNTTNDVVEESKVTRNMKKCKSCEKLISKKTKVCPHCGRDDRPLAQRNPLAGCLVTILLFGFFIFIIPTIISDFSPSTSSSSKTERFSLINDNSYRGYSDGFSFYIEGKIKNNTNKTYSYAQVTFNLYDKDGVQLGTAMANINNFEANGTWKFKAISLTSENSKVKSFKLAEITGF